MTTYRYTSQASANEAKAVGVSLPVSFKQSYEVAKFIRGKSLQHAKRMLEDVIALKRPVPMTRFHKETGHKHGMAAGRFAVNTCTYILKLLRNAEANAQFKGLSTANLVVKHIAAQCGPTSFHYGRKRRRQYKRAHVEVILSEQRGQKTERKERARKTAEAAPKEALQQMGKPAPQEIGRPATKRTRKQEVKK
jgi:large subunit ribosomal protein L22